MQKPSALQKTYKIAGILYAVTMGIQCVLAVFTLPLRLFNNGYPVNLSGSELAVFFVLHLLYLPYLILSFQKSRESEITLQSAKNAVLLLPFFEIGREVLQFAITILASRMDWIGVDYNIATYLLRNFWYIAAFATVMLFCCAAAEWYAASQKKPANLTHRLSLFGLIGFGSCILLKTVIVLLVENLGFLYARGLPPLPLKWKITVLALVLPGVILPAGVAVWSVLSRKISGGGALAKIILTPVLYYLFNIIFDLISRYIMTLIAAMEGQETLVSFNIANSSASMPNLLAYAGLILVLCAGAIEYYQVKNPSADGE